MQGLTNLDHISSLERKENHSQRRVILHLFLLNPTTMKSITCGYANRRPKALRGLFFTLFFLGGGEAGESDSK